MNFKNFKKKKKKKKKNYIFFILLLRVKGIITSIVIL